MSARPVTALLLCAFALLGCEEEEIVQGQPNAAAARRAKAAASASASAAASAALPVMEFEDADFVESEDSRDPFRDYTRLYVKKKDDRKDPGQRIVKAAPYALDELSLTGIISRGRRSIMLTDPSGFGWIVYHGEYVGKAEFVNAGGTDGIEVEINWRIDRIRPDSVVFIREDVRYPDIPPTTRVMPLYPAGDDS